MSNIIDREEPPKIYESEEKIKEDAPDAIRYLKRNQATDLLEVLGLDERNSDAEVP